MAAHTGFGPCQRASSVSFQQDRDSKRGHSLGRRAPQPLLSQGEPRSVAITNVSLGGTALRLTLTTDGQPIRVWLVSLYSQPDPPFRVTTLESQRYGRPTKAGTADQPLGNPPGTSPLKGLPWSSPENVWIELIWGCGLQSWLRNLRTTRSRVQIPLGAQSCAFPIGA